jgi:ankyrin repeat protein
MTACSLNNRAKKAKCENALKLTDDLGMSPLHAAASTGSVECVTVLLEYGAYLRFVAKVSFLLLMSGVGWLVAGPPV